MNEPAHSEGMPREIALFGCGNMAGALLAGWLRAGYDPARFTIVDPAARDIPDGVTHLKSATEAKRCFPAVMLGIKPQMLKELAADARGLMDQGALCFSMLAGVECASLTNLFPGARPVRIVPNLAARIGVSPIALYGKDIPAAERDAIAAFFRANGSPEWLERETDMALVTALVGSGPAYLYRFVDALGEAAARLGLDGEQAGRMALVTVEGAALLAASADEAPGALADKVASAGGSTREGMNVLDRDDALLSLLTETLKAARDRNIELARMVD